MNFLATNLRQDLKLNDDAVQEIYGGMSDKEQNDIVENFGREESPIRVLVASDVASEGINLHYLSHRLIHFDIPWSLMVFQQRNGRIDRYGQLEQPDIRYLMINSGNSKIKGDMRIMEILVQKEEQAYKNIGDPMLLMGKFNVEEEEKITATAIEDGLTADEFGKQLELAEDEFDPFEALMKGATETEPPVQIAEDDTLFSDVEYLRTAILFFNESARNTVKNLETLGVVEISISEELRRRLSALLPEEAMPAEDFLRLTPNKQFAMSEMARCMQNNLSEVAWPATQYLWKLHPLFTWINDKSSLLYDRNVAPIVVLPEGLGKDDIVFVMAGTIPNRKSAPVVDEWFGLHYRSGALAAELSMNEVLAKTRLSRSDLPNQKPIPPEQVDALTALLQSAVTDAEKVLARHFKAYTDAINPKIDDEVKKLMELENRHREYYQSSLFEDERQKSEKERMVEKLFNDFVSWVKDTLEIENNPYIRVIAVLTGVNA
jgi:hypothetical protein